MRRDLRYTKWMAKRIGLPIFGDRLGLVLFLGATVFFGLTWRVDFLINDNITIANTLFAVADGHLFVEDIVYGRGTIGTPGMNVVDNRLYGRNYGQVFLAVPFLWFLTAVATVAEPLVAITGVWSLALLAFFHQLGTVVDRRDPFAIVGALLAAVTFTVNVLVGIPIDPPEIIIMALQLSTIVAGAFISVFLYRLIYRMYDRVTGVLAGAGVVLVTPVSFWATIPKRHTLTALLVVLAVYSFFRSRSAASEATATRFRILAYVWGGLTAWVHAPEGAVLVVALGVVDVLTARSNRPSQLLLVGVVSVLSVVPLLATNYLISGDPLAVPRLLPSFEGQQTIIGLDLDLDVDSGEQSGGSRPGGFVATTVWIAQRFISQLTTGFATISQPESFGQTFIRRGHPEYGAGWEEPRNLSVLESMPLAALLVVVSLLGYRRKKEFVSRPTLSTIQSLSPSHATDLFVIVYLAVLLLVYAPKLPTGTSVTVRYLHPVYPLVVYFVLRSASIRELLSEHRSLLAWSYAASVLVGGQLLVAVLALATLTAGEAVQLHGLVALSAAALLVGWALFARARGGHERMGVVLVGFAGAVTTLYVLLASNVYFGFMTKQAVPFVRVLSESLSLV